MDKNDDNGNGINIEKIKQELLADDEQACDNENIVNNRELDSNIQDKDYAEFVINAIKKTERLASLKLSKNKFSVLAYTLTFR